MEITKKKIDIMPGEKLHLKPVPIGERVKTFADLVSDADVDITIDTAYDLGGATVRLPHGVVLTFKRKGRLSNGVIVGDRCVIKADRRVFYNVQVEGTWNCVGDARWFTSGCELSETAKGVPFVSKYVDDFDGLQDALDSSFGEVVFPPQLYYTTQTLALRREKKLSLQGTSLSLALESWPAEVRGAAVIFTDKDITLLQVAVAEQGQKTAAIVGGNFDVSLCKRYTKNCIEVRTDNDERMWGLRIETTLHSSYNRWGGTGIYLNPIENRTSTGYATDIRINAHIHDFAIGVAAKDYHNDKLQPYNWCTDVVIDGLISHCPVAVLGNADMDVRATIQAGFFWAVNDNGMALIQFDGLRATVSSNIYDIRMESVEAWSNEWALQVKDKSATVTAGGQFRTFVIACNKLGWPVVDGDINI